MTNGFNQKISLTGLIQNTPFSSDIPTMKPVAFSDEVKPISFKDTMVNLTDGLNQDLSAPDKLLKSAMSGDSDVDIHDVMTAMSKAELSVNVATQITSKVIQSYEKIMQITV